VKTNVTITAPEELFSLAELEAKLIGVVDKINDSSLQDFEATVATFEHKPDFRQERGQERWGHHRRERIHRRRELRPTQLWH